MEKIKVYQLEGKNGPVKNQFIIETENGRYFQSYHTVIAFWPFACGSKIQLDPKWDYSRTTGKYRNLFLHETKAETERKIASGEYEVVNLN